MYDEYRDQDSWYRVTVPSTDEYVGDFDTRDEAEEAASHMNAVTRIRYMSGLGA